MGAKQTEILIVDDSDEMIWSIGNVLEKPFDINEPAGLCRQALNGRNALTGNSS